MMPNDKKPIQMKIVESISNNQFLAAVFWGILACSLLNIIELEYNIAALFAPSPPSIGAGQFVGGIIAGYLSPGPRRTALKAGGYTGSIPILVLGPVALFSLMGERLLFLSLEVVLLQSTLGLMLVYPILVGSGGVVGAIGGYLGYWVSQKT